MKLVLVLIVGSLEQITRRKNVKESAKNIAILLYNPLFIKHYIMMKHLVLLVLIFQFFSCSSPTVSLSDLSEGDSLFVTRGLYLSPSIRVHKMSMSGKDHNLGYVPLDSNFMKQVGFRISDQQFHKEIGTSYIGKYIAPCPYDNDKVEIELSPKIMNILKSGSGKLLGNKISRTRKELLQGDISKGDIVESFPDKIYVDLNYISNASADSLFNY